MSPGHQKWTTHQELAYKGGGRLSTWAKPRSESYCECRQQVPQSQLDSLFLTSSNRVSSPWGFNFFADRDWAKERSRYKKNTQLGTYLCKSHSDWKDDPVWRGRVRHTKGKHCWERSLSAEIVVMLCSDPDPGKKFLFSFVKGAWVASQIKKNIYP